MNKIREKENKEQGTPEETKAKSSLSNLADLNFLQGDLRRYLPFLFFLAALAIVHIYNSHQAIKIVKRCDELGKEIKEARAEYISVKSELMYRSKQSQVAKRLEGTGLKELKSPPFKIIETKEDRDEH